MERLEGSCSAILQYPCFQDDKIIQGPFAQVLQGKSVIGTSRRVTGLEVPQEGWAVYAVFQKELFDWNYYY